MCRKACATSSMLIRSLILVFGLALLVTSFPQETQALSHQPEDAWVEVQAGVEITVDQIVASGLNHPVQVTHAGDGSGRLFVVEQPGTIRIVEQGGVLEADPGEAHAIRQMLGHTDLPQFVGDMSQAFYHPES